MIIFKLFWKKPQSPRLKPNHKFSCHSPIIGSSLLLSAVYWISTDWVPLWAGCSWDRVSALEVLALSCSVGVQVGRQVAMGNRELVSSCSSSSFSLSPSIHLLLEGLSLDLACVFLSHHAQYAAAAPEGPGFPPLKRNPSCSACFFSRLPLYVTVFHSPASWPFFYHPWLPQNSLVFIWGHFLYFIGILWVEVKTWEVGK